MSFKQIVIRPFWRILPPGDRCDEGEVGIKVTPGAGWGNGSHETTQLCLQAIAVMAPKEIENWRMLDFGSGSGLLSIGAAKLGGTVESIEIDKKPLLISWSRTSYVPYCSSSRTS